MHEALLREQSPASCLVLFVHGFMGSPDQFPDLAGAAFAAGCSVAAPLLPGHGCAKNDFSRCALAEWEAHLQDQLTAYAARYQNILLMGHSIGGLLALNASLNPENHIRGVFVLSSPLRLNLSPWALLQKCRLLALSLNHPVKAAYWQAKSITLPGALHIKPLWSCLKLMCKTRRALPRITIPVLLAHSRHDETVSFASARLLYQGLSQVAPRRLILEKSWHAYYPPPERALVREALLDLIRELA